MTKVSYADNTYVQYAYDAFGRKVFREEQYYDLNGPGASMGQGGSNGNGKAYGHDKCNHGNACGQNGGNPNCADHGSSHGNVQMETGPSMQNNGGGNGKGNAYGHDKKTGNGHNGGSGTPGILGSPTGEISNYQLKTEQTCYLKTVTTYSTCVNVDASGQILHDNPLHFNKKSCRCLSSAAFRYNPSQLWKFQKYTNSATRARKK